MKIRLLKRLRQRYWVEQRGPLYRVASTKGEGEWSLDRDQVFDCYRNEIIEKGREIFSPAKRIIT